jgi:general secretion pathway protein G
MAHGKPQSLKGRDSALPCPATDQRVVDGAPIGRLVYGRRTRAEIRPEGFSLLEMMLVVTMILIVASIATPIYTTCIQRAREAVLRDHLYSLRALIDRFTLDNGRAPLRLEELVEKGYLGRLPSDPFTGSNETWQETEEDAPLSPTQTSLGIVDVHSGSNDLSLEGTPYSTW